MMTARATALQWVLFATACAPRDPDGREGFAGRWELELRCDAPVPDLAACDTASLGFLTLFEPTDDRGTLVTGDHRTLWPGFEAPDGSYAGVTGPIVAGWQGAELALELVADADDPLISPEDEAAWATHRLQIIGRPGDRCWTAQWSWTTTESGEVTASGEARISRRFRECDWEE
jgi:hypothetical protein